MAEEAEVEEEEGVIKDRSVTPRKEWGFYVQAPEQTPGGGGHGVLVSLIYLVGGWFLQALWSIGVNEHTSGEEGTYNIV